MAARRQAGGEDRISGAREELAAASVRVENLTEQLRLLNQRVHAIEQSNTSRFETILERISHAEKEAARIARLVDELGSRLKDMIASVSKIDASGVKLSDQRDRLLYGAIGAGFVFVTLEKLFPGAVRAFLTGLTR